MGTFELVSSATAGLSVPLLAIGGAGAGTAASTILPTITAIAGGAITLKAIGLLTGSAGLNAARGKRSAEQQAEVDSFTFAFLAQSEPQACYRRLICDLATGQLPKFDIDTAAEVGKSVKNVQACEIRYSCPLTGEQI